MDALQDYRALHHARYLERERQRAEANAELQAVEREVAAKRDQAWYAVHTKISEIRQHKTNYQIRESVDSLLETLADTVDQQLLEKNTLTELGMDLLDAINTNENIKTDFSNPAQVQLSRAIKENVKKALSLCNVIMENEDLDVNYDMDCSRDAELAQELASALMLGAVDGNDMFVNPDPDDDAPPPAAPAPRRRGRPRRTPLPLA
jgi:signal recognition particle GTPase